MNAKTLSVQNLVIKADNKTLLDDISLNLTQGKVYALIGHNGSGKSTLIKALSGETTPHKGYIRLDDKDLALLSSKEIAKCIAYLPQKLPETQGFLTEELVMLGRYPHQGWLQKPNANDHTIVLDAIKRTHSEAFLGQEVANLSGGEKVRVWLALCLAQNTPFLLLDEPLAPLDIVYQVQVLSLIQTLAHTQGLGVVIIIHDINLAAQYADTIIALKHGKLCHIGTPQDTMQPQVLQEIFGVDFHLIDHPTAGKVAVL